MQGLFDAVDPKGNFNPGKVIAAPGLDQGNSGSALKRSAAPAKAPAAAPRAAAPKAKAAAKESAKATVGASK
jgi:hypothetical protein